MPDITAQIAQNLAAVRQRIAAAASRCGRSPAQITLVAVTKYVGPAAARALVAAGCAELAESRPQQLWEKAAALGDLPVRWHMVGHLQRNKVRRTLPLVTMIQSADSPRLIAAIDEAGDCPDSRAGDCPDFRAGDCPDFRAAKMGLSPSEMPSHGRVPILLEVNTSGEPAKHGFEPNAVEAFLPELARYRHIEVRGLMCMASLEGGLDAARRDFAALRQLRDRLRGVCPAGIAMDELSMGMSGDYEVAIEEGATMVRIGSALFEGVVP